MIQQAFLQYELVYERKPRNATAHIGMARTAQDLFDGMQQEASGAYLMNDFDGGERFRQEAAAYKQSMDRLGLDLRWDPLLQVRQRDSQQQEADRLYQQAYDAFRMDRFADAEDLMMRSLKLDSDRKEGLYLLTLTRLEPLYRQGLRATDLELWRDAFRAFKWVTDRDAGYKDAWARMGQAKEQAQVILTYVPLFDRGMYGTSLTLGQQGQLESQLAAMTKQAILDLNEPLLMLVDRDNTAQLLAEQQRQLSGVYDDRYVVEAGKLIGTRYVLSARILRYDEMLKREIEVQVQLLDAENGRIHLSDIIRVNKQELARGSTRNQLLERSAKRMAARVAVFDPHMR